MPVIIIENAAIRPTARFMWPIDSTHSWARPTTVNIAMSRSSGKTTSCWLKNAGRRIPNSAPRATTRTSRPIRWLAHHGVPAAALLDRCVRLLQRRGGGLRDRCAHETRRSSIASRSQSMPRPGSSGATACPSAISISVFVIARNCGMCSTYRPFGTAAVRLTCSLHQEVRADLHVERLGQVRHLQPRGDAADPGHVHLDDAGRPGGDVLAELRRSSTSTRRPRSGSRSTRPAGRARSRRRPAAAPRTSSGRAARTARPGGSPRRTSSTGWRRP